MEQKPEAGGSDAGIETTVVIPVWGEYATWLARAVASIRGQAVPCELVVVDNASAAPLPQPDGARLVRVAQRLPLGAARNRGLAEASTPYVVFWDADDVMLPDALATMQKAMNGDRRLVAFAMAIAEAPSGRRHRWPRRRLAQLARIPPALALLHCIWSQFPTTGAIMRTDVARQAGGFSAADSGDDWCLGVSLAFRGRIGWSEQPGRLYQLRPGSIWDRYFTLAHQRDHATAVRLRVREDEGIPEWAKRLLPVIWLGQYAALAAHAARTLARRSLPRSG